MIKMILKLFKISGDKEIRLKKAIILQLVNSMFASIPFGVLFVVLTSLINNTLSVEMILKSTLIMFFGIIIQIVLNYRIYVLQSAAGYEIMKDKRIDIGNHLRKMSMGYFSEDTKGNLLSTLTTELSFVEMYCMSLLSKIVSGITMTVVIFCILLYIDRKMALVSVLTYPIAFLFYNKSIKNFKQQGNKRQEAQSELISSIIEYVQGIKIIKSFNSLGSAFKKLDKKLKCQKDMFLNYEMGAVPNILCFQFFVTLGSGLILLCGSYFIINQQISFTTFLIFLVLSLKFYEPIEVLSANYGILKLMDVSLDKIQGIIDEKELGESNNDTIPTNYDIKFNNVSFAYNDKYTLKDINLTIPQDKITAIVGPSGSGKTTLTRLIARFWDVQKGEILIGDICIRDIKYNNLLSMISVVFQDVYLFNDTLYNNIKFGNPNASKEQIIEAAKKANCHNFIEKMENGYESIVGEGGNTLSGGEKQRISIARAILKDAPIILLDEATASVDPENEKQLQQAINQLVKNKTLVIIAHKLAHIKNAHQIVVVDDGRVVKTGSHKELLSDEQGVYYKFWEKRQNAQNWVI